MNSEMNSEKYMRLLKFVRDKRKREVRVNTHLITAVKQDDTWVEYPKEYQVEAREQELIRALEDRLERAGMTYRENKRAGSPIESVSYDAGRAAGIQEALELTAILLGALR